MARFTENAIFHPMRMPLPRKLRAVSVVTAAVAIVAVVVVTIVAKAHVTASNPYRHIIKTVAPNRSHRLFVRYDSFYYLCLLLKHYKMKKTIIAILALGALVAGCKSGERDWKGEIEAKEEAFVEYWFAVADSTSLSESLKEAKIDSCFAALGKEVGEIADEALKIHTDDSVAIFIVKEMYDLEIIDGEGFVGLVEKLGPTVQSDSTIVRMLGKITRERETAVGTHFRDFEAVQPSGATLKLSDFAGRGKYCLVDFWASWCGPCKGEIPNLKKVYDKYSKKGLVMVSVAVWDEPQASVDTAAVYGIKWNHIINGGHVPTDLYGIQGIPHILLIGPDGTILARDLRGNDIAATIGKYL